MTRSFACSVIIPNARAASARPTVCDDPTTALSGAMAAGSRTRTDENGAFQLNSLPLGSFLLRAGRLKAEDHFNIATKGTRVTIDGTGDITGLQLVYEAPSATDATIAGLVIHDALIIPEPGQAFNFHGFRFRVLRKSRNRITSLRITPLARSGDRRPPAG